MRTEDVVADADGLATGCVRVLLEIAVARRTPPLGLTDTERDLAKAVAGGSGLREVVQQFRLAPERIAYSLVRILHAS